MGKSLWNFDKFWVIWVSCLDRPRTINEIQRIWNYDGNALYQKGLKAQIWSEMVKSNILQAKGKVKVRGVTGQLLYGTFDWVVDYVNNFFAELKLKYDHPLPSKLFECAENKKKLIYFLDTNRDIFFLPHRLKILFNNKENLKNYYELCITVPIIAVYNQYMINTLKKRLGIDSDTIFLFSQSMIFNPVVKINLLGYYKEVLNDLSSKELPLGMVNESALFKLWKENANKFLSSLNL